MDREAHFSQYWWPNAGILPALSQKIVHLIVRTHSNANYNQRGRIWLQKSLHFIRFSPTQSTVSLSHLLQIPSLVRTVTRYCVIIVLYPKTLDVWAHVVYLWATIPISMTVILLQDTSARNVQHQVKLHEPAYICLSFTHKLLVESIVQHAGASYHEGWA